MANTSSSTGGTVALTVISCVALWSLSRYFHDDTISPTSISSSGENCSSDGTAESESDLLELLKRSSGTSTTDPTMMHIAASRGHLAILKWGKANGCAWNEMTCAMAAHAGHLEALRWLKANGCPWDEMACAMAARGGQLEALRWLRENDCPWDGMTRAAAGGSGHTQILQYCLTNGC